MNSDIEKGKIIEYLLGNLPADDAEQFDELCFTDDDFAEKLKATENDLIDLYIRGDLDGEKRAKFESYYLASPIRLEKLRFAEALQDYFEQNINQVNPKDSKKEFFTLIINFFSVNKLQFGFVLTALLILILGGFWIFTNRGREPEISSQKTPVSNQTVLSTEENTSQQSNVPSAVNENKIVTPAPKLDNRNTNSTPKPTTPIANVAPTETKPMIASFVLTPPLRGNQPQNLAIPAKTMSVAIQLQLETDDYSTYSVSLQNSDGKSILKTNNLKAEKVKSSKVLNLKFPAKLLTNGIYSLSVAGLKSGGTSEIIGDYPFRAVLR